MADELWALWCAKGAALDALGPEPDRYGDRMLAWTDARLRINSEYAAREEELLAGLGWTQRTELTEAILQEKFFGWVR